MRIALAQLNPTVGDIAGNTRLILEALRAAAGRGAQLVVCPELAVIGYPPKDLLLKPAVVDACRAAVDEIAAATAELPGLVAIVGYPCPADGAQGLSLYNAAAVCSGGRMTHRHVKSLLPTYDVFDERRYFEPGPRVDVTPILGQPVGISICEDLWNDRHVFSRQLYHDNPIDALAAAGARLFVNCSASPFVVGKHAFRLNLMAHVAKEHGLPLVYCNQVGGNDELVFDGNSCVFDAQGQLVAQAKDFEEDLLVVDVPVGGESGSGARVSGSVEKAPTSPVPQPATTPPSASAEPGPRHPDPDSPPDFPPADLRAAYRALVLGIRDYCRKCGFWSVVLGLSGGIDSALTAVLCAAALGPDNVRGVSMPSRFSSGHSKDDAADLAKRLGIHYHVVPIEDAHRTLEGMLQPHFEGRPRDTTEENIQARIRGVTLMAMSNKFGSLLVTTGNKSELAVGYCTLYGDMCGGLAAISDVPKTMVWALSRWINTPGSEAFELFHGPTIPQSSIDKPPSAELRENQTDQDSLPPYDVLDDLVERYVEREQSAPAIISETGLDPDLVLRVVRMIDLNEYKRKQSAPGLKITGRAFGFGRRMPIAQRYRWGR